MCLVPKDERSYERTLQFRRFIYQNSALIGLGIEQQYHFTAHITLGYFGEIPPNLERDRLSKTLAAVNEQALGEDEDAQTFCIHRAELRKFDDMIRYYREPNWSVLKF
jgi:2'-5' RNA ligase